MQRIDSPINAIDDVFVFLLKFRNFGARGSQFRFEARIFSREIKPKLGLRRGFPGIATL